MDILRKYISEALLELQRHKKETGEKYSQEQLLSPYLNDPYAFVHFSDLNKLGINPRTRYQSTTPAGIYAYPVNKFGEKLLAGDVPFAGEREYMHIFIVRPEFRDNVVFIRPDGTTNKDELFQEILDSGEDLGSNHQYELDKQNFARDLSTIERAYVETVKHLEKQDVDPDTAEYINEIGLSIQNVKKHLELGKFSIEWFHAIGGLNRIYNQFTNKDIGNEIMNLQEFIRKHYLMLNSGEFDVVKKTEEDIQDRIVRTAKLKTPFSLFWANTHQIANGKRWAKFIMKFDIAGIVDYGSSIIHENEPIQAVFFSNQFIEQAETIQMKKKASVEDEIDKIFYQASQK